MFRNFLKGRHEAPAKQVGGPPPPGVHAMRPPNYHPPKQDGFDSVVPVEYNCSGLEDRLCSEMSINPVDYRQSAPGRAPPPPQVTGLSGTVPSSAFSINPVDYRHSPVGPPGAGAPGPPVQSSTQSPMPVDYRASAPAPTPKQAAQPRAVVHPHRLSHHVTPPYAYVPPAQTQPQELPGGTQSYSKFAYYAPELGANDRAQRPIELPASSPPPRYELPNASIHRPSPAPSLAQQSPNPGWKSPGGSSVTTLVPSPRSEVHSPPLGSTKTIGNANIGGSEDDGVKKFVVDVFCPLKRDANRNRREQIPRDVREFRLAKVALIPIVAGKRTFVSLDVVFGEVDKSYAGLVEKHFSFSHKTHLSNISSRLVNGDLVYVIGPLNIAYRDGDQSEVYVRFPTGKDRDSFEDTFWNMWQYVEQTAPGEQGRIS